MQLQVNIGIDQLIEMVRQLPEKDVKKFRAVIEKEKTSVAKKIKPANKMKLSDFSFAKSRKVTKAYKGSFTDSLIEERRSEL